MKAIVYISCFVIGVTLAHETHRGRFLYSPWISRDFAPKYPDLRLVADIRLNMTQHDVIKRSKLSSV